MRFNTAPPGGPLRRVTATFPVILGFEGAQIAAGWAFHIKGQWKAKSRTRGSRGMRSGRPSHVPDIVTSHEDSSPRTSISRRGGLRPRPRRPVCAPARGPGHSSAGACVCDLKYVRSALCPLNLKLHQTNDLSKKFNVFHQIMSLREINLLVKVRKTSKSL